MVLVMVEVVVVVGGCCSLHVARYVCCCCGAPIDERHSPHSIWNQDFILEDELHSEGTHACALTYVEVLIVDRWAVEHILDNYLPDKEVIARARAFYKFKHAVITWAHEMARERLGEVRALPRPRPRAKIPCRPWGSDRSCVSRSRTRLNTRKSEPRCSAPRNA